MKIFFLILVLSFAAFGQVGNTKAIYDFKDSPTRIFWKNKDSNCCDLILVEGVPYRILKANGLQIAFVPKVFGSYFVMNVYVRNDSEKRVNVLPEESTLGVWRKSEDALAVLPSMFAPTDADKIAQKMGSRQGWINALSLFGAGLAQQTATVTNNRTGETATITAPDTQAQDRAQNQARANAAKTGSLGNRVVSDAFKSNTLFPGDTVSGNIYFKADKHERGVFVLKIDGVEYGFIYTFPKEKK